MERPLNLRLRRLPHRSGSWLAVGCLLFLSACSSSTRPATSSSEETEVVAVIDMVAPHSKEEFLVGGRGFWSTVIDFTVTAPEQLAGRKLSASYDDHWQPIPGHELKVGDRIRVRLPAPRFRDEMDLANLSVRLAN